MAHLLLIAGLVGASGVALDVKTSVYHAADGAARVVPGITDISNGPPHAIGYGSKSRVSDADDHDALDDLLAQALTGEKSVEPSPDVRPAIRLMGLQRSGTNLWYAVLKNMGYGDPIMFKSCVASDAAGKPLPLKSNADDGQQPCWKHFRVNEDTCLPKGSDQAYDCRIAKVEDLDRMTGAANKNIVYFVSIKSPLAWVTSFEDSQHGASGTSEVDLVTEWVSYVSKWIHLQSESPHRIVLVPYEHLLGDTSHVLKQLDRAVGNVGFMRMEQQLIQAEGISYSPGDSWASSLEKYLHCTYLEGMDVPHRLNLLGNVTQRIKDKLSYKFDEFGCLRIQSETYMP